MDLIQALNKRYATKKFDPNRKIPADKLEAILEALRLTPTSYGLQLMKTVIVENPELREELVAHSYGQNQVKDASHLLVLCREKSCKESHISDYISTISETRGVPEENLAGFRKMMVDSILGMDEKMQNEWMSRQVYIALGNLMTACAILDIDACPMEGFIKSQYDKVLGLDAQNLHSVLAIPIGYRAEDDHNASLKKVRRSKENFVVTI